eukprot:3940766-Rhodomonas_salina.4
MLASLPGAGEGYGAMQCTAIRDSGTELGLWWYGRGVPSSTVQWDWLNQRKEAGRRGEGRGGTEGGEEEGEDSVGELEEEEEGGREALGEGHLHAVAGEEGRGEREEEERRGEEG